MAEPARHQRRAQCERNHTGRIGAKLLEAVVLQVIDTDPSVSHFSRGRYDLPLAPFWVR
jgi:hypothetical protein